MSLKGPCQELAWEQRYNSGILALRQQERVKKYSRIGQLPENLSFCRRALVEFALLEM